MQVYNLYKNLLYNACWRLLKNKQDAEDIVHDSFIKGFQKIDQLKVIASIKEFLDSIGESKNYAVISNNDIISIKSINGKTIERDIKPTVQMFSCTHCGHVTPYEVVHNAHMKIHYL